MVARRVVAAVASRHAPYLSPIQYRHLPHQVRWRGDRFGRKRVSHMDGREYWRWGVDAMPLMDHGGRPPGGQAETFEAALEAFKAGFEEWLARIPAEVWELNRDHIKAGDRWRE
jgi:hypothetical protein